MSDPHFSPSVKVKQTFDILIVDDERELRELLALEIEQMGHQVIQAASGKEAKQLFAERIFRLVISDLTMPDGNGLELAKWIMEQGGRTKVAILSGNVSTKQRAELKNAGVLGILEKPYSSEDLAKILRQALLE